MKNGSKAKKEEIKAAGKKLRELSEEELFRVTGGITNEEIQLLKDKIDAIKRNTQTGQARTAEQKELSGSVEDIDINALAFFNGKK